MRETDVRRDRERERRRTPSPPLPATHPVLALQRAVGNRAVAHMLARVPATSNSVQIHGVGEIKVSGGNLEAWTDGEPPQTVEVTSHPGRHSKKLEHLSGSKTKSDVKVTIAPANQAGQQLQVGAGTVLEIKGAEVEHYAVADGMETWRLGGSMSVHRTKIVHHIS